MSWEANTWACKQRMKLPQEQLVLLVLGNCADPDAVCFSKWPGRDHWWKYLSRITRLSRSSLFRHINTIVALGLASRSMIVLADGSKRPTITLNLHATFDIEVDRDRYLDATQAGSRDESHSETHCSDDADDAENDSDISALDGDSAPTQNESHHETPTTPSLTHGTESVPPVGLHIESILDSNLSPLPPASGGTSAPSDLWKDFVAVWAEPIQRMAIAHAAWARMATDKRPACIAAARGYWAWLKAHSRPPTPQSAQSFIRDEPGWTQWLRYVPKDDGSAISIAGSYPIGSPEGRAILALYDTAGLRELAFITVIRKGVAYWFKPIGPRLRKLGEAPDRDSWPVLNRQQAAAWEGLLREVLNVPTRRPLREGDRAPWEWPPKVNGELCAVGTGPPAQPEMSDEDAADFR